MTEHTKLRLSPAEHRIAVLLARGTPRKQIAKRLHLSRHTVNSHVASMRRKTGSQWGSLPALVHVLLLRRLIPTPKPRRAAPDLGAGHRGLLEALVHEHNRDAVAKKIGLSRDAVRQQIRLLRATTGARTTEHLVTLAHGWQMLGTPQHATGRVPSAVALPAAIDRRPAATARGTGPVKVPSTRTPAQLTPIERRIATFLVQGVEVRDIGPLACMTEDAVKGILKAVRRKFGCTGSSQAVLAHALLSSGSLAPPPAPSTPPPSLSTEQSRLLIAVATRSTLREIGESLGLGGVYAAKRRIGHLLTATDSEHPLDLIVRAHAWPLFDVSSSENTEAAQGAVSRSDDRAAQAPPAISPMASSPLPQLTPVQQRVADLLTQGVPAAKIPTRANLSVNTVVSTLNSLRSTLDCVGSSQAVLAHQLVAMGLVDAPPTPAEPPPALSRDQHALLRAITTQSTRKDICRVTSMGASRLDTQMTLLLVTTGSADRLQLVLRAHGWRLIKRPQPSALSLQ